MAQASLAPDLASNTRSTMGSEASLWLFGLTSLTLVFASLAVVGLIAQSGVGSAALSGFATGIAVMTAVLGLVAVTYVGAAARRAGYIGARDARPAKPPSRPSDGLEVAPIVPAAIAHMRRKELADGRKVRSKQAQAISTAEASQRGPRPVAFRAPPVQLPALRSAPAQRAAPIQRVAFRPTPVHPSARPALFQVAASNIRRPYVPPAPWPLVRPPVARRA